MSAKYLCEKRHIFKSAESCGFRYRLAGFEQCNGTVTAQIICILNYRSTGVSLEFAAECVFIFIYSPCELIQVKVSAIIFMNE